jgi:hypothetical protein
MANEESCSLFNRDWNLGAKGLSDCVEGSARDSSLAKKWLRLQETDLEILSLALSWFLNKGSEFTFHFIFTRTTSIIKFPITVFLRY